MAINYTLDFEVQTWFFKPTSNVGLIEKIYGSYPYPGDKLDTESTFSSGASGGLTYELKGKIEDGDLLVKYTLFEP